MFPKEFIVEDGQVYYRKKPLHRQPLFWTSIAGLVISLLLSVVVGFLLLALGSQTVNEFVDEHKDTNYETSMDWSEYDEYSIGETAELADLSIKVESMEVKDADTLVDDSLDKALVVTLTLENTSGEDYYFDEYEFSVYGDDTSGYYVLDYQTYSKDMPEKIKPGEKVHLTLYYGVDDSDTYRFTYNNVYWATNDADAI
ncbi:hypothetical protein J2T50_001699 [Streptococcus gallinaceus]|uniref:DUF4352 domain-containing protein n=1 Tax=Streptococcus gallinaceus TaxID=165758 RepID=UPI00209DA1BD|nr:DUF4352 domain-containing protein [Streptococcus gallinaceus]MCP1639989.1 hypothetical protein [Streptococcus gallinaceus]MCP1770639.1 hypothetical protein [Streptococcus gallinaceus]